MHEKHMTKIKTQFIMYTPYITDKCFTKLKYCNSCKLVGINFV
jgi:hypothetical protein